MSTLPPSPNEENDPPIKSGNSKQAQDIPPEEVTKRGGFWRNSTWHLVFVTWLLVIATWYLAWDGGERAEKTFREQRRYDSLQLDKMDSQMTQSRQSGKDQNVFQSGILDSTGKQIAISRDQEIKQLRAYVYLIAIRIEFVRRNDSIDIIFPFTLKNTGQTPAFNIIFQDSVIFPRWKDISLLPAKSYVAFESGLQLHPEGSWLPVKRYTVRRDYGEAIQTGAIQIEMRIRFSYDDVFGTTQNRMLIFETHVLNGECSLGLREKGQKKKDGYN
jgi:hypothetical protein